jgi:hypothetical protein
MKRNSWRFWIVKSLRWVLAVVLISTALGNLLQPERIRQSLSSFQLFPRYLIVPLAIILTLLDLTLGIDLLRFKKAGRAAWGIFLLNLSYCVITWVSSLRGLKLNQNICFEVFWGRPLAWNTTLENASWAFLSFALCVLIQQEQEDIQYLASFKSEIQL